MHKTRKEKIDYIIAFFIMAVVILAIINNSTTVLKIAYPLKYKEYVYRYSVQNGVDPYLAFAVIKAESSFDPQAVSKKNAKGLMQITEKTANWGAQSLKIEPFETENLYNPEINIMIGCWYLSKLMKEFDNNIDLVIAAYNGGSGNVNEWLRDRSLSDSGNSLQKIPFKETENYLKKVKKYYYVYKRLYERSS